MLARCDAKPTICVGLTIHGYFNATRLDVKGHMSQSAMMRVHAMMWLHTVMRLRGIVR